MLCRDTAVVVQVVTGRNSQYIRLCTSRNAKNATFDRGFRALVTKPFLPVCGGCVEGVWMEKA